MHPARLKARAAGAAAAALLAVACSRPRDGVLATVGRETVTKAEFERKLGDVSSEYQSYIMTPAGRRQFFDIVLREKLILAAAEASAVPDSQGFREDMGRFEADQRERLKEYREYLLSKDWLDSLRQDGTLAVSDAEIRAYYEAHPKEVRLRHILVATPEEAKRLMQELRAGASFKALAREKSEDAETAASGGTIPPFMYGELLPELGDVAFPMRVGEIAGPVRTEFGYHIVRKEGERTVPYAEAQERIRKVLEKKKLDAYLDSLRARYPVRVLDAEFK